ncbi:MAG: hypothetical protein V3W34_08605 [Phycisphaerae bacterium]
MKRVTNEGQGDGSECGVAAVRVAVTPYVGLDLRRLVVVPVNEWDVAVGVKDGGGLLQRIYPALPIAIGAKS